MNKLREEINDLFVEKGYRRKELVNDLEILFLRKMKEEKELGEHPFKDYPFVHMTTDVVEGQKGYDTDGIKDVLAQFDCEGKHYLIRKRTEGDYNYL